LAALTELLLSADNAVEAVRKVILSSQEAIEIAIAEEASSLGFYHGSSKYKDIDDAEVEYAEIEDIRIVGLGGNDCTVAFEGSFAFSAVLRWTEHSYQFDERYGYNEPNDKSERVNDHALISGRAKLRLANDRAGIDKVTLVEFDQGEIEVSEEPWRR
jgi:hypothetical protein